MKLILATILAIFLAGCDGLFDVPESVFAEATKACASSGGVKAVGFSSSPGSIYADKVRGSASALCKDNKVIRWMILQ